MSLPNVWQLSTKTCLPCNTGATMQCDSVANPAYDGYGDEQGRLDRWNRFTQWAQRMYQWIEAQKRLNSAFDPTVDEVRNEHNILCAICANPLGVRWPTTTIGVMGVQHNVPEAWAEGPMSIFRIGFVPPRANAGLSSRSRPAESGQGTCEYVHTGCLYGLMVNRGRYEGVTPFRFERMLTNENAIPYAGAIMERLIAEAQTVGMDIPPEVYEEVQEQVRFDAERRRNPAYQPPPMRIRFMDDDEHLLSLDEYLLSHTSGRARAKMAEGASGRARRPDLLSVRLARVSVPSSNLKSS